MSVKEELKENLIKPMKSPYYWVFFVVLYALVRWFTW
jgi:hypothetical protein